MDPAVHEALGFKIGGVPAVRIEGNGRRIHAFDRGVEVRLIR